MQNKKKLKIKKASQPIQWLNESKQKIGFEKPFLGIYDVRMCFELINICFLRYLEGEGGGGSLTKGKSSS